MLLRLTSPLMRGDQVKAAQQKLAGHNVFKTNYHPGAIDGIYGQGTARASKRAKYWLGYPQKDIRGDYGEKIKDFLSGKVKLPPAYTKRRNQRIAASKTKPIRVRALEKAATQLGVKEAPPGSNRQKYGVWYGVNGAPWCAIFVTWCYEQVASQAFARGSRWSYVPYIVDSARRGTFHTAITHSPQPGDLVCFDWDKDGVADHVGFFEKALAGGNFQTIEGNTGEGNNSNGGQVMRRTRDRSAVQAFVHVGA